MTVKSNRLPIVLACALVAFAAAGAHAQPADAWRVTVAPYLMGAAMSGTTAVLGQQLTIDASASDIFSNLQFVDGYGRGAQGQL